jgi:hypothetical protein
MTKAKKPHEELEEGMGSGPTEGDEALSALRTKVVDGLVAAADQAEKKKRVPSEAHRVRGEFARAEVVVRDLQARYDRTMATATDIFDKLADAREGRATAAKALKAQVDAAILDEHASQHHIEDAG